MKSLWSDESGTSMSILMIALAVFSFGIVYTALTYAFNVPIQAMNDFITDGLVSAQTIEYFEITLDLWKAVPLIFVFGLILWCYERSKGVELDENVYIEYMVLLIVGTVTSVFLVYGFGLCMDSVVSSLDSIPELANIPEDWDSTGTRNLCIALAYIAMLLPGLFSTILYTFHPILKQRENTFFEDEDDEEYAAAEQDIMMGQF